MLLKCARPPTLAMRTTPSVSSIPRSAARSRSWTRGSDHDIRSSARRDARSLGRSLRAGRTASHISVGRLRRGSAAVVSRRRSDSRRAARRDDGRDDRRATVASVAMARTDGLRSGRLVQLGPPRQRWRPERRAGPPRMAELVGGGSPGINPERRRLVRGRGARRGALSWTASADQSAQRAPLRHCRIAAPLLCRCIVGVPAERIARRAYAACGQRLRLRSSAVPRTGASA